MIIPPEVAGELTLRRSRARRWILKIDGPGVKGEVSSMDKETLQPFADQYAEWRKTLEDSP